MSILPKLIYTFKTNSMKYPTDVFKQMEKLKMIKKRKGKIKGPKQFQDLL